jgi:hypothetical protein
MKYFSDSDNVRKLKLEQDVRDAYVEVLSAHSAVDRLQTRYPHEDVARFGGSFLLLRSLSAARAVCDYFFGLQRCLTKDASKSMPIEPGNNDLPI